MSVGMPAFLYLQEFGSEIWRVFGTAPYHVGSSVMSKTWRDVDVRLMLPDEEFDSLFGKMAVGAEFTNGKWCAMCKAFSLLGKHMTGLPIDFQIMRISEANEKHKGPRSYLGRVSLRVIRPEPDDYRVEDALIAEFKKTKERDKLIEEDLKASEHESSLSRPVSKPPGVYGLGPTENS